MSYHLHPFTHLKHCDIISLLNNIKQLGIVDQSWARSGAAHWQKRMGYALAIAVLNPRFWSVPMPLSISCFLHLQVQRFSIGEKSMPFLKPWWFSACLLDITWSMDFNGCQCVSMASRNFQEVKTHWRTYHRRCEDSNKSIRLIPFIARNKSKNI